VELPGTSEAGRRRAEIEKRGPERSLCERPFTLYEKVTVTSILVFYRHGEMR
jgi:hypothetical protein